MKSKNFFSLIKVAADNDPPTPGMNARTFIQAGHSDIRRQVNFFAKGFIGMKSSVSFLGACYRY
jgi:hypothetical protein